MVTRMLSSSPVSSTSPKRMPVPYSLVLSYFVGGLVCNCVWIVSTVEL